MILLLDPATLSRSKALFDESRMHPGPPPLSQLLRHAIADAHLRIEGTAIARAMIAASVTRPRYAALLASLAPLYAALDQRVADIGCLPIPQDLVLRGAAVHDDLAVLGYLPLPSTSAVLDAHAWIGSLAQPALVGACYVVAGSGMGSVVLRPLLARALGLSTEAGLRTHAGLTRDRWKAVCADLDAWQSNEQMRHDAAHGAWRMMDSLLSIYAESSYD